MLQNPDKVYAIVLTGYVTVLMTCIRMNITLLGAQMAAKVEFILMDFLNQIAFSVHNII